jgi:26S proteasome regulatory subunit N8
MTVTPEQVVVHPLVLLSVTDHYNRAAKNTKKRVVGILLGQQTGGKVNIANSYAGMNILNGFDDGQYYTHLFLH